MDPEPETDALHRRLGQLESLLQRVDDFPDPASREQTRQIVQTLLEFHGVALVKILDRLEQGGQAGKAMLDALADDELVSGLLLLHGLHPLDFDARVRRALDKVRPYLASHGGHVELVSVTQDGAIRLRLEGSCHGCPSSRVTLKQTIEEAIYAAAPDVTAIAVEGAVEEAPAVADGFVPLTSVLANGSPMHAGS